MLQTGNKLRKTKSPVKLFKHNIKKVQDVKRRQSSRTGGGTMTKIFD